MERVTITVQEVLPIRDIKDGKFKKLLFKSTEGQMYSIFNKVDLFSAVVVGAVLDLELSEIQDTQYPDLKVNAIYKDSRPVGPPKPFSGGKPPFTRDTASIETQTALKEVGECIRAGLENIPKEIVTAYWAWIRARMITTPATPSATKGADIFSDGSPSSQKTDDAVRLTTWENLCSLAKQHGLNVKICELLKSKTGRTYKDLPAGPPAECARDWMNAMIVQIQSAVAKKA